ncbi:YnfC family lipoprotein, partial [Thioclava sp. BHET1]
ATPSTDPIKKLDYTAVTLLNNQRVGNVKQSCEYDSHAIFFFKQKTAYEV